SVQTSDLALSGIAGATVTGVTVLPGNTTARFTIGGLVTEGTLAATIPAGAITDPYGNPGLTFSSTYTVDIGTVAFPTPLTAKAPPGSLVYDPTVSGVISPAGDADNFTVSIDPGQKITVYLHPASTLKGLIQLFDPANNLLGSATNWTGLDAVIQTVATGPATDTYRIQVSSDGGTTTGAYTLGVVLNAREEAERHNGPANDTFATAEDINGSF